MCYQTAPDLYLSVCETSYSNGLGVMRGCFEGVFGGIKIYLNDVIGEKHE